MAFNNLQILTLFVLVGVASAASNGRGRSVDVNDEHDRPIGMDKFNIFDGLKRNLTVYKELTRNGFYVSFMKTMKLMMVFEELLQNRLAEFKEGLSEWAEYVNKKYYHEDATSHPVTPPDDQDEKVENFTILYTKFVIFMTSLEMKACAEFHQRVGKHERMQNLCNEILSSIKWFNSKFSLKKLYKNHFDKDTGSPSSSSMDRVAEIMMLHDERLQTLLSDDRIKPKKPSTHRRGDDSDSEPSIKDTDSEPSFKDTDSEPSIKDTDSEPPISGTDSDPSYWDQESPSPPPLPLRPVPSRQPGQRVRFKLMGGNPSKRAPDPKPAVPYPSWPIYLPPRQEPERTEQKPPSPKRDEPQEKPQSPKRDEPEDKHEHVEPTLGTSHASSESPSPGESKKNSPSRKGKELKEPSSDSSLDIPDFSPISSTTSSSEYFSITGSSSIDETATWVIDAHNDIWKDLLSNFDEELVYLHRFFSAALHDVTHVEHLSDLVPTLSHSSVLWNLVSELEKPFTMEQEYTLKPTQLEFKVLGWMSQMRAREYAMNADNYDIANIDIIPMSAVRESVSRPISDYKVIF